MRFFRSEAFPSHAATTAVFYFLVLLPVAHYYYLVVVVLPITDLTLDIAYPTKFWVISIMATDICNEWVWMLLLNTLTPLLISI